MGSTEPPLCSYRTFKFELTPFSVPLTQVDFPLYNSHGLFPFFAFLNKVFNWIVFKNIQGVRGNDVKPGGVNSTYRVRQKTLFAHARFSNRRKLGVLEECDCKFNKNVGFIQDLS